MHKGLSLNVPCRSGTTSKSSETTTASQQIFFTSLLRPTLIHRAMSTLENNAAQNQTSVQGVGTTSTPLLAPARTQKDGGIGNSTVGTFSVCDLLKSLLQSLTIKDTGQVRIGPNAQGLLRGSFSECWILRTLLGWGDHGCCKRRTGIEYYLPFRTQ